MKPTAFFLFSFSAAIASLYMQPASAQSYPDDSLLLSLLQKNDAYFADVLKHRQDWNVQIIYTTIDRSKKGKPRFHDHYFNVDTQRYYYPASTVKFPIAALALQKLRELNRPGLDRHTTMITGSDGDGQTEVSNDPSARDGRPTIDQYIRKILLVSDNDAFNRLYEFLGQEYINETLHAMGYTDVQILHRLSISLSESQNRHTNPVKFIDSAGTVIYEKPATTSAMAYMPRHDHLGNGYMKGDELVHEPFDFSAKNRMNLPTLHMLVRSIMFPEAVDRKQRFNLGDDDYAFMRRYMSMNPTESDYPSYDSAEFWPNYIKTIYYGTEKTVPDPHIRIFNKTGTAYGFLIDASYFADFDKNIEFMVSAIIYCNSDGIFNDDKYDYETIGNPFFKHLGQVLYDYELTRPRKHKPDLSSFRFTYDR